MLLLNSAARVMPKMHIMKCQRVYLFFFDSQSSHTNFFCLTGMEGV